MVLRMLNEIGSVNNVPDYIKRVGRRVPPDGIRPPRSTRTMTRARE